MNMFFLSVSVLYECYLETIQGDHIAVIHFSNIPKLVSPELSVRYTLDIFFFFNLMLYFNALL